MSPAWPGWQAALVMTASSPPGASTRWHAANIIPGAAAAAPGRPAPGSGQPGVPQAVTTARAACPASGQNPASRAAGSAGPGRARRPAPAAAAANTPAAGSGVTTRSPGLVKAVITAAAAAAGHRCGQGTSGRLAGQGPGAGMAGQTLSGTPVRVHAERAGCGPAPDGAGPEGQSGCAMVTAALRPPLTLTYKKSGFSGALLKPRANIFLVAEKSPVNASPSQPETAGQGRGRCYHMPCTSGGPAVYLRCTWRGERAARRRIVLSARASPGRARAGRQTRGRPRKKWRPAAGYTKSTWQVLKGHQKGYRRSMKGPGRVRSWEPRKPRTPFREEPPCLTATPLPPVLVTARTPRRPPARTGTGSARSTAPTPRSGRWSPGHGLWPSTPPASPPGCLTGTSRWTSSRPCCCTRPPGGKRVTRCGPSWSAAPAPAGRRG